MSEQVEDDGDVQEQAYPSAPAGDHGHQSDDFDDGDDWDRDQVCL